MTRPSSESSRRPHPALTALAVAGAGALAWNAARLALELLGPTIPYRLARPIADSLDSEDFVEYLSIVTDAAICRNTRIQVLRNGEEFYPAQLQAIAGAQKSIQLEFFEFFTGEVTRRLLDALTECARRGVQVDIIIDALGSFQTRNSYFNSLRQAGGRVYWYHPIRFKTLPYLDCRTHRKLLVVDGEIGFIGGAGQADHWLYPVKNAPPWRDTMFRVEGRAVAGMLSVQSENWLECTGEILSIPIQRDGRPENVGAISLVVTSTPQEGATRARVLFQVLLESARKSITITTPYFLPDRSARRSMLRAMRERGVTVRILTNGRRSDHPSIMRLSRSLELELLRAGAQVFEYQPGMLHAKLMVIDQQWTVLGSANFDHRSFALNDEVSMAVLDRPLAQELDRQFERDLASSCAVTPREVRRRSLGTRVMDDLTWLVRREE